MQTQNEYTSVTHSTHGANTAASGTHTPGPWSADPEGELAVSIEDAVGNVICEVHGASNDPLCAANAKLIAAAPDLLTVVEALVYASTSGIEPWKILDENSPLMDAARDALGKASTVASKE